MANASKIKIKQEVAGVQKMIIDQLAATVVLYFLIYFGVPCTRFTILKTVTG